MSGSDISKETERIHCGRGRQGKSCVGHICGRRPSTLPQGGQKKGRHGWTCLAVVCIWKLAGGACKNRRRRSPTGGRPLKGGTNQPDDAGRHAAGNWTGGKVSCPLPPLPSSAEGFRVAFAGALHRHWECTPIAASSCSLCSAKPCRVVTAQPAPQDNAQRARRAPLAVASGAEVLPTGKKFWGNYFLQPLHCYGYSYRYRRIL
eukprot:5491280-Amphidinium_carterae.1